MTRAFVFPGQGSQAAGMGQELADAFPAARLVFEEVDETLKQNLSRIMFEGPEDELRLTENAQPALMAVSMAIVRVLREEGNIELGGVASHVAGHSLGEYSALAAVDSLSLSDAARLLKLRGTSMQVAVPVGEGAMAALMGLSVEDAEAVAAAAVEAGAAGAVCDAANDNAPGQVVIAGAAAAVEAGAEQCKAAGARRAVMLDVSGPFHSPLMAAAKEEFAEALHALSLSMPEIPIVQNVNASVPGNLDELRANLLAQIAEPVLWSSCVTKMVELGVTEFVECGPGNVLAGLIRRISKATSTTGLGTPDGLQSAQNG